MLPHTTSLPAEATEEGKKKTELYWKDQSKKPKRNNKKIPQQQAGEARPHLAAAQWALVGTDWEHFSLASVSDLHHLAPQTQKTAQISLPQHWLLLSAACRDVSCHFPDDGKGRQMRAEIALSLLDIKYVTLSSASIKCSKSQIDTSAGKGKERKGKQLVKVSLKGPGCSRSFSPGGTRRMLRRRLSSAIKLWFQLTALRETGS